MNSRIFSSKIITLKDNAINPDIIIGDLAGVTYKINIDCALIGEIAVDFVGAGLSYGQDYTELRSMGYLDRRPVDLSVLSPFSIATDLPPFLSTYSSEIWKNYIFSRRNRRASQRLLNYIYVPYNIYYGDIGGDIEVDNLPLNNQIKSQGYKLREKLNINASILTAVRRYFLEDWERLYDALFANYDPIQNYSMTDTVSQAGKERHTIKRDTTLTKKDTGYTENEVFERKDKTTATESVYAINVGTLRNTKYTTTESEDTYETTPEGERILSKVVRQKNPGSAGSDEWSGSDTDTLDFENRTTTTERSGNIGVTTSQQMIESEIQLRKNHFLDLIYNDMDTIFTVPYWGSV